MHIMQLVVTGYLHGIYQHWFC